MFPRYLASKSRERFGWRYFHAYLTVPTVPFTLNPEVLAKVSVLRTVGFVALVG